MGRLQAGGPGPDPATPEALREGVRDGVLAALREDLDRSGLVALRSLALAGVLGVATAIGALVLFSRGTLATLQGWHLAVCAAAWSAILVECFLVVLLQIEGRRVPAGHAATLALIGFALAAALGMLCPHPHYVAWWNATWVGGVVGRGAGPLGSAACFGGCLGATIALAAAVIANARVNAPRSAGLSALLLFLVMLPAVMLQLAGQTFAILAGGTFGLSAGIGVGLTAAAAIDSRRRLHD